MSFEDEAQQASYKRYYCLPVEIKNIMLWLMDNFFDQTVRNNLLTYGGIWKIATGQEDDYTTGCLLDYNYFKDYDKMIAVDLSKQQLDDDQWLSITF